MKIVTFNHNGRTRLGVREGGYIIDLSEAASAVGEIIPYSILPFLEMGERGLDLARRVIERADVDADYAVYDEDVRLLAPVPKPPSMRDGYAFRQHVETARRNRGLDMIPAFDKIPVFYFTNHNAVFGPGPVPVREMHLNKLDFELECAVVIGRPGRDIPAAEADEYIAGYTIMNDLSARALQMEEMTLNLGPAKGKDFATVLGPHLVTKDELTEKRIESPRGERFDLKMTARVNGIQVSEDSLKNMNWTFAQIIERVSYGVDIYPGDVIGSGTCGTGCFLELNGSKTTDNQWLKLYDVVELEIEGLGVLSTTIVG